MKKISSLKYKNAISYSFFNSLFSVILIVYFGFVSIIGFYFFNFSFAICFALIGLAIYVLLKKMELMKEDRSIPFTKARLFELISFSLFALLFTIYSLLCVKFVTYESYFEIKHNYYFIPVVLFLMFIMITIVFDIINNKDIRKECKFIIKNVSKKKSRTEIEKEMDFNAIIADDELVLENICNNFIFFSNEGIRSYSNDSIIPYNKVRIKSYYEGKYCAYIICTNNKGINRFVSKIYLTAKIVRIIEKYNIKVDGLNRIMFIIGSYIN